MRLTAVAIGLSLLVGCSKAPNQSEVVENIKGSWVTSDLMCENGVDPLSIKEFQFAPTFPNGTLNAIQTDSTAFTYYADKAPSSVNTSYLEDGACPLVKDVEEQPVFFSYQLHQTQLDFSYHPISEVLVLHDKEGITAFRPIGQIAKIIKNMKSPERSEKTTKS